MHPKFEKADHRSRDVIGAAIAVHKAIGAGLLESIYSKCMMRELDLRKIPFASEVAVPIQYGGITFNEHLKLDIYVDDCLIIELKAIEKVLPIHKAQLFTYMKLLDAPLGLLINFHEPLLRNGINRMILPGAGL